MPEPTLEQKVKLLEEKLTALSMKSEMLQREVADLREAIMQLDPNRPPAKPAVG